MEKELKEMIKNKNLTNEQWQELVCDILQIVPQNRYNKVDYLINKDELEENLTFEKIIEIIEDIEKDAENEMYYENSYYDYGVDEEIVEGDESWIDEIDRAFIGIKGLLNKKEYEHVMIAYEKIFEITEGNYEEFYSLLPGYYNIEGKLESKTQEHYLNYLEAIYYSKNINKVQKFANAFEEHRNAYKNENIINNFCKRHDEFKNNMIKPIIELLTHGRHMFLDKIIFILLMEENGTQAVMEFLKKNIEENTSIFIMLYDYMLEKENYDELLHNLYFLENIKMPQKKKEFIYQKIINIADIVKDEKLKEKYLYKINELNPSLKYALKICKNLQIEEKIKQIEQLNEKIIVDDNNQKEKILIELLLGKIEKVYIIFEKMENYQKKEIEDLIIYYILKFGNREIKEKKLLTEQLGINISELNNSLDIEEMFNIMEASKKNNITKEFIEKIEKNFMKKIAKKTKTTLEAQERGRYQKVATYLIILVEHLYQEDRKIEAKKLLVEYQEEYRRFNSYKKCIKEELEKSSISNNI